MISEDWLLPRIAIAKKAVKSLDEATSARDLGARLLDMTHQFGVVAIMAGSIPRELPPSPSGSRSKTERWGPLPPTDAEAEPPPALIFGRYRTHLFDGDPEAAETAYLIVDCAHRRDDWIREGKGLLLPIIENEADAYGLGFFGPALSPSLDGERSLAFLAHNAFARLLRIDRIPAPRLSERQIMTLKWAAEGKTDQEIAAILNVSGHTVDKYMRQIKQELNAVNRTSAIVMAMRHGLIA